ncbi:hypothetical protein [Anaerocolumna sp. MB42-C2]|uniref:hypothetical protein n=1 Tax=Anaerocolumna sp. MB42-C2 TaxID=3070997 RepID=UPI0027E1A1BE|nr:hypothetical protein [Anaerocolumna sp. MB42-C2]WMJ85489.1 hypothetical protein RBU59_15570 [Anaerocolumna sp. MB42-C2]
MKNKIKIVITFALCLIFSLSIKSIACAQEYSTDNQDDIKTQIERDNERANQLWQKAISKGGPVYSSDDLSTIIPYSYTTIKGTMGSN